MIITNLNHSFLQHFRFIYKNWFSKKVHFKDWTLFFDSFSSDCCELKIITDNCIMLRQSVWSYNQHKRMPWMKLYARNWECMAWKASKNLIQARELPKRAGSVKLEVLEIIIFLLMLDMWAREINLSLLRDFKNWYSMCLSMVIIIIFHIKPQ